MPWQEKKGTGPLSEKGPVPFFSEEAEQLGAYTGRMLTSAYLDGQRDDLTAQAEGRKSSAEISEGKNNASPLPTNLQSVPGEGQGEGSDVFTDEAERTYDLRLMIEPKGIACSCVCGPRTDEWTIPKTIIRRPHKAVAIGTLFDQLAQGTLQGFQLGRRETNDPEFLLTPRAANALVDQITKTIRLAQKPPDEMVRIDLPPAVSNLLEKMGTGPFSDRGPVPIFSANRLCSGQKARSGTAGCKGRPGFFAARPPQRHNRRRTDRQHPRPHLGNVRER